MKTVFNTHDAARLAEKAQITPWQNSTSFCPWQAAGWDSPQGEDEAKREAVKLGLKTYASATLATLASAGSPSLAKVARTIIRRINYPKALCGKVSFYKRDSKLGKAGSVTRAEREKSLSSKSRPLLSENDECEIFQTCAGEMIARGILQSESLTGEDWKALFRASRATLGIDKARAGEISTSPEDAIFTLSESVRSGFDGEAVALARVKLARRLRYWHSCIAKAREVSTSRQKRHAWQNQLATLRKIAAGNLTFSGMSQLEMQAVSKAKARLSEAVQIGEKAFDSEAESEARESDFRRLRSIEAAMYSHLCA